MQMPGSAKKAPAAIFGVASESQCLVTPPLLKARWERRDEDVLDPFIGRHVHLDAVRALCVLMVAVDHGNPAFCQVNVLFCQSWVFQLLCVISGVSWSMSSLYLGTYLWRLAGYFILGVGANLFAAVITGMDWRHNGFGVVFQMWFVVGLSIFCVLTAPLKVLLRRELDSMDATCEHAHEEDSSCSEFTNLAKRVAFVILPIPMIQLSVFVLFGKLFWVQGQTLAAHTRLLLGTGASWWASDIAGYNFVGQLGSTLSGLWILYAGSKVLPSRGLLTWVLIVYIYVSRIFLIPTFYGQCKAERVFSSFELFLVGVSAASVGLRHRAALDHWVGGHWVLLVVALGLLWDPTWLTRFHEVPPTDFQVRMRVKASEAICVVVFLTSGERLVNRNVLSKEGARIITDWALLVFMGHEFCHNVLKPPLNWLAIFAMLPLCWGLRRSQERSEDPEKAALKV